MTCKCNILLFVICLFTLEVFAQNPLNFAMKADFLSGKPQINQKKVSFHNNNNSKEGGSTVAMAFTLPIKGKFRFGAEIGVNTFKPYVDLDFNGQTQYLGHYKINQVYLALVPEYRIKDFVYVNAGIGYHNDFESSFSDGDHVTQTDLGQNWADAKGISFYRDNPLGYFAGVGVCPNLTKQLAFITEI